MVTINGFPKHGNHALAKSVQMLGVPCAVNHIPFGQPVGEKHVFIKRDPRNGLVSWLRMNGQPEIPGMFITAFRLFQSNSLVAELAEYEGWLRDAGTLVVRYEDLISGPEEIMKIAEYIGVAYQPTAFENLPGLTRTWAGAKHSDYRELWSPEVETVWAAEGGSELLYQWGY
jgi:hypothetical protein